MLWVGKRKVSRRGFFYAPKTYVFIDSYSKSSFCFYTYFVSNDLYNGLSNALIVSNQKEESISIQRVKETPKCFSWTERRKM